MPKLQDRVQETTTSTGTGTFTLNGAVTGYITFNSGFSNGDVVWYVCDDGAGNWEIGYGTVGTGTLTRTVFQSSNSNNLVSFGVGSKRIFCTAPYTYLLPDQTGNSGQILTTDGTTSSWTAAINGVSIGQTTAAAGAFTTLSASSTVTLSGGTANGVLYLNGSKVATSGTALVFDGTNLGLGVTPSGWSAKALEVGNAGSAICGRAASTTDYTQGAYYNAGWKYAQSAYAVSVYEQQQGAHYWLTAGSGTAGNAISFTQAMTLDASGRLGLGQTSPSYLFDVSTGQIAGISTIARFGSTGNGNVGRGTGILIGAGGASNSVDVAQIVGYNNAATSTATAAALAFQVANSSAVLTEVARFDNAGNFGLGVTPSAWGSASRRAIQIGPAGAVDSGTQSQVVVSANRYFSGSSDLYINSAPASAYQQQGGVHSWYTAPSGTAGNAISFTQAMTLDASGDLGLGVTPSAWAGTAGPALQINKLTIAQNTGFDISVFLTNGYATSGSAYAYIGTAAATLYRHYAGQHQWLTAPSGTAGNAISFTQAMTLDASGDLGIGTTSPGSKLQVNGTSTFLGSGGASVQWGDTSNLGALSFDGSGNPLIRANTGLPLIFQTNGSNERARIDSSGKLLVGTTTTSPGGIVASKSTVAATQCFGAWNAVDAGNAYLFYGGTGSASFTARYQIYWNFTSGTGTAGFISDYRQKDNVRRLTNGLDAIKALKPSTYRFKNALEDASGFIAHEVQEVIPQAVSGRKDEVDEDGNPKYQMLDQTHIIPYLTAAIQELSAELNELKRRIN